MAKTISNTDDIIDGRDIVARIDELEALESTLADAREEFAEAEPESDELTCGIPAHSAETYIAKLLRGGFSVATAEYKA